MKREHLILSRPLAVADIPGRGRDIKIEAGPEERARIAAEFGIPAVLSLMGTYHLTATKRGAHVEGRVEAVIRQVCVVSLDPFETRIEEPVDLAFAQEAPHGKDQASRGGEITVSLEEEEPPEPIVDGKIDLGAVTLEFLALGLDPYPRKPGVELARGNAEDGRPPSPFALLASRTDKSAGRK